MERIVLDTQKTVTGMWFTKQCLLKVIESMKKLRLNSRMDTWFPPQDNALANRAKIYIEYLTGTGLKLLKNPSYNPHLTLYDFALFSLVTMKPKGMRFSRDETSERLRQRVCLILY